jgi:hypothetical protein
MGRCLLPASAIAGAADAPPLPLPPPLLLLLLLALLLHPGLLLTADKQETTLVAAADSCCLLRNCRIMAWYHDMPLPAADLVRAQAATVLHPRELIPQQMCPPHLNNTVRICSAGLHLSLRMSKQMRPSLSMLGWYIFVRKRTCKSMHGYA